MSNTKQLAKLFAGSVTPIDTIKRERGRDFGFYALRLFALFNIGFIAFQLTGLILRAQKYRIDRQALSQPAADRDYTFKRGADADPRAHRRIQ